jgi:putative hydrolase of the HAD superfamily
MKGAWLFLDIGNVLLDVERDRSRDLFVSLTGVDREEFDWIFFDSGLLDLFNTGRISEAGFLHRVRGDLRHRGSDLDDDQIRRVWNEMLVPVPGTAEWVHELQPLLEGIWIVSDINAIHWRATREFLDRDPLARLAGSTLSCDLGVTKPARAFFEHALQGSGARPDRIVYLDDRAINIEGARKLGIDGTLFTRLDLVRDRVVERLKGR